MQEAVPFFYWKKQGAGGRGLGAESREQGAGSWVQRAGSRGQGAWSVLPKRSEGNPETSGSLYQRQCLDDSKISKGKGIR